MRILIPILGFAPQGGYRVLSQLADAWIRKGHECAFLVPASSQDPYFPTVAKIIRSDRKGPTLFASRKKASGMDNILCLFAGLRKIASDYDVIFANHSLTAWPVRWAKSRARKIYYVQAYEPSYYPIFRDPIKHLLARFSYMLNLRQITNSGQYRGMGLKPVDTIPPGIDLSIFTLKEQQRDISAADKIIVGTIGRIEPYKGTATALAAYRLLREREPRLHMEVGFGNVPPADDIEIVPIKGDRELAAYYRSLDLLVVSCQGQHGAPHYPLIEAMASGTPVVHTDYYPGDASNSWIAEDASCEGVAAAMRDMLRASKAERAERVATARAVIERDLAWDAIAERFEGHFNGE
jgi:glycosyltransferase involved in cell wall biosynthesis